MSKGIHELSESECLKYFHVVRAGIEEILEDTLVQEARKKKSESTAAAIAGLKQTLRES